VGVSVGVPEMVGVGVIVAVGVGVSVAVGTVGVTGVEVAVGVTVSVGVSVVVGSREGVGLGVTKNDNGKLALQAIAVMNNMAANNANNNRLSFRGGLGCRKNIRFFNLIAQCELISLN
jgi:hypothetical protein